ncbi:MAG TPA: FHA domain-containing protein [Planctomycetaceae bacterium]|nr:FHA domain-containing protein [Planctomycetaceae bacterium]HQZ63714.1 FHA domain-containing protein [Planctomycetaceae bacterium]
MFGRLTPVGGGAPLMLVKKKLTLGRRSDNDLVLPCGSVSGNHCELELVNGHWWVRDLGSRNGVSVNNVKCETSKILPGGVLRLGNQRLRCDYKVPVTDADEEKAMNILMELSPELPAPAVARSEPTAVTSMTVNQPVTRPAAASSHSRLPVFATSKTARRFMGKLVPLGGGDPIPLLESPLIVGRRSACDITLRFPDVSSRHCTLTFEDGFWVVDDAGSRNGIRVNGERIERKVLYPDDRISFASHRFTIHYVPEGAVPPAEDDTFAKSLLEKIGMKDLSRLEQKRIPGSAREDDDEPKRMTLE